MVHEVFNGLAGRQDAHDALRIPVGHIPGGCDRCLPFGDGSKPWYLVNPKIAGTYGCSSH
jgi:hypothetical protein